MYKILIKKIIFIIILICNNYLYSQNNNKFNIVVQYGHNSEIDALVISHNNKYIASGGRYDNSVKIWNLNGQLIRTLYGHYSSVRAVAFSSDDKYIISGSKEFKIWTINGELIRTIKPESDRDVYCIDISKNGQYLVGGGYKSGGRAFIKLWDTKGNVILNYQAHKRTVIRAIALSSDGRYIVSLGQHNMKLWDRKGNLLNTYNNINKLSTSVSFSLSDKYIIEEGAGTINIWNLKGDLICSLNGYMKIITITPDDKYMYTKTYSRGHIYKMTLEGEIIRKYSGKVFSYSGGEYTPVSSTLDGEYVVTGNLGGHIKIFNKKGLLQKTILGSGSHYFFNSYSFSQNEKYITTIKKGLNIANTWKNDGALFNILKGNRLFNNMGQPIYSRHHYISLADNGEYIAVLLNDNKTIEIRSIYDKKIQSIKDNDDIIILVSISKTGQYIAGSYKTGIIKIWNNEGDLIQKIENCPRNICKLSFSKDDKYLIAANSSRKVLIWKIDENESFCKNYYSRYYNDLNTHIIGYTPIHKYFAVINQKNISLFDKNGKLISLLKSRKKGSISSFGDFTVLAFSPNGEYLVSGTYRGQIIIWDYKGQLLHVINAHSKPILSISISSDSKLIASIGEGEGVIKIWDFSGKKINELEGAICTRECSMMKFYNNDKYISCINVDQTFKIWNLKSKKFVSFLSRDQDWIVYTSDGYFDCSRNGGDLVRMPYNYEVFGIDQFALKYNRPDIILKRMGSKNQALINHFHNQYQKRLKRMGFTEGQLKDDLHVPRVQIIKINQDGKYITLQFQMKDTKYDIKQYNIYINDVPLFGQYGKKTHGRNITVKEKIELTSGENKIEVTCINKAGAESYRALTHAVYDKKTKGDLYFIGFGVSKYKNPEYNLKYAHKDVMDLSDVYSKMKRLYNFIHIKTYLNENVTINNIKNAKKILKNAAVDDTIVLFIAGHGVHDSDKEETYYYLTYNADINNLEKTSAPFKMLEDILQGIAPRKKLFLIDTCESGELDEKIQDKYFAKANTRGITARTTRAIRLIRKKKRRNYLYKKDRYIYNDLMRRSGAIVFSSSQGGELSYEKDDYMNGLFTEAIIKGLEKGKADKNYDKIISTDELREYVIRQVSKMSDDLQHPAVDRDNIYQKLSFPVVK